jgi:hypothetical protein
MAANVDNKPQEIEDKIDVSLEHEPHMSNQIFNEDDVFPNIPSSDEDDDGEEEDDESDEGEDDEDED